MLYYTILHSTVMYCAAGRYVSLNKFQPELIGTVSLACKSLALWVRAVHTYAVVGKAVEPKREQFAESTQLRGEVEGALAAKRAELTHVEAQLVLLQGRLADAQRELHELQQAQATAQARLQRAERLLTGLAAEKQRWGELVRALWLRRSLLYTFESTALPCAAYRCARSSWARPCTLYF